MALVHSGQEASVPTEQADEGTVVLSTARGLIDVDSSIAAIVASLNAAGVETVASCSGHGNRPGNIALRDGRELIIARSFDEARRIDRLFPVSGSGERVLWPCGHERTPENSQSIGKAGVRCRTCRREITRTWWRKAQRVSPTSYRHQDTTTASSVGTERSGVNPKDPTS